jgi:Mg2+ and Co2+ transporter CorA
LARCLITVEDHDSPAIAAVWQRMHQAPDLMQRGADFVLYAVADAVVDTFLRWLIGSRRVSMRSRSASSRRSQSRYNH